VETAPCPPPSATSLDTSENSENKSSWRKRTPSPSSPTRDELARNCRENEASATCNEKERECSTTRCECSKTSATTIDEAKPETKRSSLERWRRASSTCPPSDTRIEAEIRKAEQEEELRNRAKQDGDNHSKRTEELADQQDVLAEKLAAVAKQKRDVVGKDGERKKKDDEYKRGMEEHIDRLSHEFEQLRVQNRKEEERILVAKEKVVLEKVEARRNKVEELQVAERQMRGSMEKTARLCRKAKEKQREERRREKRREALETAHRRKRSKTMQEKANTKQSEVQEARGQGERKGENFAKGNRKA